MEITLENSPAESSKSTILPWLSVLFFVYILLVSIGMIGDGFKWAAGGAQAAADMFTFASNPFTGLMIGLIATIMVQSSSTTTSIIVGLVAGGLPVSIAIPMILGTNIGTSTTATLVSLANLGERKAFRRSFTAATAHGLFNVIAVFIFLPLEIMTGFLGKLSDSLIHHLSSSAEHSLAGLDFIKPAVKPLVKLFSELFTFLPGNTGGIALVVAGLILTFVSISYLGKTLKKLMVGRAKQWLHRAIGHGPLTGISSGMVTTFLVQSSSTSTSLVIPLVGAGIFKAKEVYPFTLGANIGTTITALLAATTLSGPTAIFGLQIALVHVLFNTLSVLLIYGNPLTRMIPFNLSRRFAHAASRDKRIVFIYVATVFFVIPGLMILVTR